MKRPGHERVLGLVVRQQHPLRSVWLFADNVRATVGRQKGQRDTDADLERALARVAAHEVIHAVAPDAPPPSSEYRLLSGR